MFLRGRSLTFWIAVSIVVGIAIGYFFPEVAGGLRIFSQIFLRLIRTIVAPLPVSYTHLTLPTTERV